MLLLSGLWGCSASTSCTSNPAAGKSGNGLGSWVVGGKFPAYLWQGVLQVVGCGGVSLGWEGSVGGVSLGPENMEGGAILRADRWLVE
jgi:hypothetical protein